jgi:hypothetical protein
MTAFNTQMNFEVIESKIIELLGVDSVDNDFQVIGYAPDSKSAEAINNNRLVEVFYFGGQFPEVSNADSIDQTQHKCTYRIELTVSEKTKDTDDGLLAAGKVANQRMNDLIRRVYQSIMQGKNLYLNTDTRVTGVEPTDEERYGIVSDRKIENIQKTSVDKDSGHAIVKASMNLTCQTSESPETITGIPINDAKTTTNMSSDPTGEDTDTGHMGVEEPKSP